MNAPAACGNALTVRERLCGHVHNDGHELIGERIQATQGTSVGYVVPAVYIQGPLLLCRTLDDPSPQAVASPGAPVADNRGSALARLPWGRDLYCLVCGPEACEPLRLTETHAGKADKLLRVAAI